MHADLAVIDDEDLDRLKGLLNRFAAQAPRREDDTGMPWRYQSPYELVQHLGSVFPARMAISALPTLGDRKQGRPPFENVFEQAVDTGQVYCEGFAIWAGDVLPHHHAWLSPDGTDAIEVHRSTVADAYVGIAFDTATLVDDGGVKATGVLTLWVCRTGLKRFSTHH